MEIFYGIGALILFVALIYGAVQYSRRTRRDDSLADASTRAIYRNGEAGDPPRH